MSTVKIYDMTDIWNDANTTFTSIKMNANDVVSSANSLLIDLQVDGVTKFAVNKDGVIVAGIANTSYINSRPEAELNVNSAVYSVFANNATYLGGKTEINLNVNNAVYATVLNGSITSDQVTTISNGTGAVSRISKNKLGDIINVKDFGAVGDGVTNDTAAIQSAINYANTIAPAVVMLSGTHNVGGNTSLFPITIKGGVTLCGDSGEIVAATPVVNSTGFPVTLNVRLLKMESDSKLHNTYVDANGLFQYTLMATDVNNVEIKNNEFVGWKYCVTVENSTKEINLFESSDVVVSGNKIHLAASENVIYPIWFASKRGKWIYRATIEDNTIIGYPGAYSATNQCTADMMELQGIADSTVSKNKCINSGELGFAVVRLSKNVLVDGNMAYGADAGGIQIGTGAILTVNVAAPIASSWGVNDIVYTNQADGSFIYGYLEYLDDNDVYLRSISGGVYNAGDTLTNGIRIRCDTVTNLKTDMIVVGATTSAQGKILRIADPDDVSKPKYIYVANVAGQSIQFANGETISNGAISKQIVNINRTLGVANVAIANIASQPITSTTRTNNISVVNNISYNNGLDVTANKITMTTLANESLWAVGQTITGQTSGATATIDSITSTTISTFYLSNIVGAFSAGEIVKNAALNSIEILTVGGIYNGLFVQQSDNIRIVGNACYDTQTPKTQDYGLNLSQSKNIFISGNDFSGNATDDTSFNGVYTLSPTSTFGFAATPKGKPVVANGTITTTSSYTVLSATANVSVSNILGGIDGARIILSPQTNSNTTHGSAMSIITIVDTPIGTAGGNIRLANNSFAMDSSYDTIELLFKYTGSGVAGGQWLELSRSKNDGMNEYPANTVTPAAQTSPWIIVPSRTLVNANTTLQVNSSFVTINATSNATISTILEAPDGARLVLTPVRNDTGNVIITISDTNLGSGGGNLRLANGNFTMTTIYDNIELMFRYTGTGTANGQWIELGRSKNDNVV